MVHIVFVSLFFVALVASPVRAAGDPAAACTDAKAKTTGKKAAALLKAYGKNIKKPNPAKLASDISKAQSKMTKGFVKAEGKGGCATTGDVAAIEAKTDVFVATCIGGGGPCGDGIIGGGEDCDEGAGVNGTAASCCNIDCTLKPASTVCTDTDGNVCTTAGCDGVSGACDQNHVDAPASTPCPDTDGDSCTTSGCDGLGACDQGHAQAPASTLCTDTDGNACTTAGCDGVGGCDQNHVLVAASTVCPDTDGNTCTSAGCDGLGACNQMHVLAPPSNPCPDVDGNVCTSAGCDGLGACNQLHILAPPGFPCGNPADTDCSNPDTCDGLGSCSPNDEAHSFPCPDTDGNVCTSAGCTGAGACNQGHVSAPASIPCPDIDGNVCTSAGCNGAGGCSQNHVFAPASTPCTDLDPLDCGTAGCDGAGGCDQDHIAIDCCAAFPNGFLTFETGLASGNCGVVRNFRCSNDISAACGVDSDCGASNTCDEQIGGGLPRALECGALYTGGGLNAVPLPIPVPDMGKFFTEVTSCNSGAGELITGPTAPGDGGGIVTGRNCTTGRTCTGGSNDGDPCVLDADCDSNVCTTNCTFGAPLPIPNTMTPPVSYCSVNDVAQDASGTTQCEGGDTDVSVPLRINLFLNGDLFSMLNPPNIPGIQPCPLCDTFCSVSEMPCNADSDCPLTQTCDVSPRCLGGPHDSDPCTPATSDSTALGDSQNAYPTSHDCPPEPSFLVTELQMSFALTSGTIVENARDLGTGVGAERVFSGFCRDNFVEGTLCFEGDTEGACTGPPGNGVGVPCDTDADCAAPYESCAQRHRGAFGPSQEAATQITVFGEPDGQCLGDGATHAATLVSVFDIPPTFNSFVDANWDLPGPGAVMLQGAAQLSPSPSGAFVDMGRGALLE